MKLKRRDFVKSAAAAAAIAPMQSVAIPAPPSKLFVYDSRLAQSRNFAKGQSSVLDVATQDACHWDTIRRGQLPDTINGATGWSDWVVVRGLLEERGRRVTAETRRGAVFHWSMS